MNNKIKGSTVIIAIFAIFLIGIELYAAQQANDYRTFVYAYAGVGDFGDGNNATMYFRVAFVPVYPSVTYQMTNLQMDKVKIDLSKPTKINDQIAQAVKEKGTELGYNVTRVYLPSYDMKIP